MGTTLLLAGLPSEAGVIDRVRGGGGHDLPVGCVCGGALAMEAVKEEQEGT